MRCVEASHIDATKYVARMSPVFNESSVIQCFERSNTIEIHNGHFYPGLPQIVFLSHACMCTFHYRLHVHVHMYMPCYLGNVVIETGGQREHLPPVLHPLQKLLPHSIETGSLAAQL